MRRKWEKAFFSTNWKETGVAVVTINNWIAANAEFFMGGKMSLDEEE